MAEASHALSLYTHHGHAAYRTARFGPSLGSLPRPPKSKRKGNGMTIAGPPTANAENNISLTDELWMEDEPTEQEESERREKIASLLKNNPRPVSHSAVAKTFENNAGKHWDRFYQRNGNRCVRRDTPSGLSPNPSPLTSSSLPPSPPTTPDAPYTPGPPKNKTAS